MNTKLDIGPKLALALLLFALGANAPATHAAEVAETAGGGSGSGDEVYHSTMNVVENADSSSSSSSSTVAELSPDNKSDDWLAGKRVVEDGEKKVRRMVLNRELLEERAKRRRFQRQASIQQTRSRRRKKERDLAVKNADAATAELEQATKNDAARDAQIADLEKKLAGATSSSDTSAAKLEALRGQLAELTAARDAAEKRAVADRDTAEIAARENAEKIAVDKKKSAAAIQKLQARLAETSAARDEAAAAAERESKERQAAETRADQAERKRAAAAQRHKEEIDAAKTSQKEWGREGKKKLDAAKAEATRFKANADAAKKENERLAGELETARLNAAEKEKRLQEELAEASRRRQEAMADTTTDTMAEGSRGGASGSSSSDSGDEKDRSDGTPRKAPHAKKSYGWLSRTFATLGSYLPGSRKIDFRGKTIGEILYAQGKELSLANCTLEMIAYGTSGELADLRIEAETFLRERGLFDDKTLEAATDKTPMLILNKDSDALRDPKVQKALQVMFRHERSDYRSNMSFAADQEDEDKDEFGKLQRLLGANKAQAALLPSLSDEIGAASDYEDDEAEFEVFKGRDRSARFDGSFGDRGLGGGGRSNAIAKGTLS